MKIKGTLLAGCFAGLIFATTFTTSGQPFAPTNAPAFQGNAPGNEYVPGEVLIKFRDDVTDAQIATAFRGAGLRLLKHIRTRPMEADGSIGLTRALAQLPVEQAVALLSQLPGVEYAQPNWIYRHHADPNETFYTQGQLWGMLGGASTPANDFGSHAAEAWALNNAGSKSVYVGVIDEGIQVAHPDLAGNIWMNPYDPADGNDNDSNGFVDDINGWDFLDNNSSVYDSIADDHGTHVAGTIGAAGGNGLGVVGVNWSLNIISGKFIGSGGGYSSDAIEAIDYMISLKLNHGLNLVALNNSWGGAAYDQALLDAIVRSAKAQILFVASAGNGDWRGRAINTDSTPAYPACYNTTAGAGYDSVISITAIDSKGAKASFANYGKTTVDLGAPGVAILSTVPDKSYAASDGTSMAAPHVTGAIALYAAKYPGASAQAIKQALFASVDPTSSLSTTTVTKGRLNIAAMLAIAPPGWQEPTVPPTAPSGLSATTVSHQEIKLSWIDNSVNESSFTLTRSGNGGTKEITVPANLTSYTDTGLTPATTYTYSLKACNAKGCTDSPTTAFAATPSAPPLAVVEPLPVDSTTSGSWIGKYGAQGYHIFHTAAQSSASYVSPTISGYTAHTWEGSTFDERAPQIPGYANRIAACYYTFDKTGTFYIDLPFQDQQTHKVSLYCVDWDRQDRQQIFRIFDRNDQTVKVAETSLADFPNGKYVSWNITGPVVIKVLWTDNTTSQGDNAVVSALFFDDPTGAVTVLPKPSGLVARAISKSQIDLSWVDNSSDENGFEIQRSTSSTSGFVKVAEPSANSRSYPDTTGLAANTTYYYRVRAIASDSARNSDFSNTASAKTPRR